MLFFFKEKPIVVDAFIDNSSIYEHFPLKKLISYSPEWWKKYPATFYYENNNGITLPSTTIKKCDGVIELFKNTIALPMWTDCAIRTKSNGEWFWNYSDSMKVGIISHNKQQYGSTFNDYIHLKISSPWILSEKTGIKFYFSQPFWNQVQHKILYQTPPGIVDYKYQSSTNVNIFLDKIDQQFIIEAGQVVAYIVPMTEKNVLVKCHLISEQEYKIKAQKNVYEFSFTSKYKKLKKIEQQNESKCPFGFGK